MLLNSAREGNSNLELMLRFYQGLERDLETRMNQDTNGWFPAILRHECCNDGNVTESSDVEDKLNNLKSMFIKHLSGEYDLNLCYGVIIAIVTLEKDLRQNNRIRNRILIPLSQKLN